jgi:RHS repeat-associated protein
VVAVQAQGWTEAYAYDAFGNLAFASRPGDDADAGALEHEATAVVRAGRTVYERDGRGRTTRVIRRLLSGQRRVWTYSWDAEDRLVQAALPDGTVWQYAYDAFGRRVDKSRLHPDGTVAKHITFTWDGDLLAEQTARNEHGRISSLTWDYEPDSGRPLVQRRRQWAADAPQEVIDEEFHAIVTDLVGAPTELLDADGRIAWQLTSSLFGSTIAVAADPGTDCPLRFPGQYHDAETGLHYNHQRYYDPGTAAYLTPDPLGLVPAPNDRAYVDNPMVASDPMGLAPKVPRVGSARWKYLDQPGFRNYVLIQKVDGVESVYYSGMFGPGSTEAGVKYRHANNHNRFNPAKGDRIEVEAGTRTYGQARLREQELNDLHGTFIGKDGNNYRGNRQNPMKASKRAEYKGYAAKKATLCV